MSKFECLGRIYDVDRVHEYEDLTRHSIERTERLRHMRNDLKVVDAFLVDKDHPNGYEEHYILEDATIMIYNADTKKFITALYGRPGQIQRYYNALSERANEVLLDEAYSNILTERNKL